MLANETTQMFVESERLLTIGLLNLISPRATTKTCAGCQYMSLRVSRPVLAGGADGPESVRKSPRDMVCCCCFFLGAARRNCQHGIQGRRFGRAGQGRTHDCGSRWPRAAESVTGARGWARRELGESRPKQLVREMGEKVGNWRTQTRRTTRIGDGEK